MRLDRTRITIRERSLLDILDMSMRVTSDFGIPLLLCFAVVVIPLMVLNWWLASNILDEGEYVEAATNYCWTMSLLVFIQSPLVSLLATPYLGSRMFLDESSPRQLLSTVFSASFALVWTLLILRGIGLSLFIALGIRTGANYEVWLSILALAVAIVRASRPFITEIVLLERNPMFSRDKTVITMGRRSSALHGPNSGDLIARWIGCGLVAIVLVASIVMTCWFVSGMLFFDWNWGNFMLQFCFPLCLWIVVCYFTVVRFLSYLDLRIRREGWEVELIVRAAAAAMKGVAT